MNAVTIWAIAIICTIATLALIRNQWVYKHHTAASDEDYNLPAYEIMMLKFWIWDIEKFKQLPK